MTHQLTYLPSAQQRQVLTSQGSAEWYTPAWCIALVRQVLGEIDLDPASSEQANATVQAQRYYTDADNGLLKPWRGRVFLNPPYNGSAAAWSRRLAAEYERGTVQAAILLVFAKLGYQWFTDLFDRYPTCLVRERISFVSADRTDTSQAKHASAFVYFGPDCARFGAVFAGVGRVIEPESAR
jgi:phage N-6-adenine-methyltransferase